MSEVFGFEKLEVWQRAIALVSSVYNLTRSFPQEERFGLVSQMRRAAVSVSANIAEGNSRLSRVEQARFIEMAYGSLLFSNFGLRHQFHQGFVSD